MFLFSEKYPELLKEMEEKMAGIVEERGLNYAEVKKDVDSGISNIKEEEPIIPSVPDPAEKLPQSRIDSMKSKYKSIQTALYLILKQKSYWFVQMTAK